MPNIRFITYGHVEVSGDEMPSFVIGENVRRWCSSNNKNVLLVESQRFAHASMLELTSAANIPFSIGIHLNPGNRSIGQIRYDSEHVTAGAHIMVNDRWMITKNCVRQLAPCVPQRINEFLSINIDDSSFQNIKQARIDISINEGRFAALIVGSNGIIFVRFNGNYAMKRYGHFVRCAINREIDRRMLQVRPNNDVAEIQPMPQVKEGLSNDAAAEGAKLVEMVVPNWSIRNKSSEQSEFHPFPSLIKEGSTIKYVVWEFLGSGSFGACFKIANFLITEKFACKFIDEEFNSKELIQNEIDILRSLKHPNVIEFIESLRCKRYTCIILSLCARSLSDFIELKNCEITLPDCRFFIAQILIGIDYIHSKYIIHRDLKPSNILLTKSMQVKISDFGSAIDINKNDNQSNSCGTIHYMSPEVLRHDGFSLASDIWAAGVILFKLVNGSLPFLGRCTDEVIAKIKISDYKNKENCDREAEILIRTMLEKTACERANAAECLKEDFIVNHEIIVPEIINDDPNEIYNVVLYLNQNPIINNDSMIIDSKDIYMVISNFPMYYYRQN